MGPNGWVSANPRTCSRRWSKSLTFSISCATETARCAERSQFERYSSESNFWLSVCPVTRTLPGMSLTNSAIWRTRGRNLGCKNAEPSGNAPFSRIRMSICCPKFSTSMAPCSISLDSAFLMLSATVSICSDIACACCCCISD
ncbi:Uncharacterised protein [Vibrio cholerae]|nr:Uncharacterised protein [Vibrio cholerae]CSB93397.1 Uncharacterised protein [Vibrio cholerae]